jgi:hypothetical protein
MNHGHYLLRVRTALKTFLLLQDLIFRDKHVLNNLSLFENLNKTHNLRLFLIIGGIAVKYRVVSIKLIEWCLHRVTELFNFDSERILKALVPNKSSNKKKILFYFPFLNLFIHPFRFYLIILIHHLLKYVHHHIYETFYKRQYINYTLSFFFVLPLPHFFKVVQPAPRACPSFTNLTEVLRLVYLENLDDSSYDHRSQPKENT